MKFRNILISAALLGTLTACDDMFEPAIENTKSEDQMLIHPDYAQGLLGYGYAILPYSTMTDNDFATDDCVTNDKGSNWISMALGSWTSSNNPVSQWDARKCAIQYENLFLSVVEKVTWSTVDIKQKMFVDKLTGEALGLRALHSYFLLQAHAGYADDGVLYGYPIILEPENGASDYNKPRNTFAECVNQIIEDCDKAIELLPTDYVDLKQGEENLIPEKYTKDPKNKAEIGGYNLVFGAKAKGRLSGRIVEAIRAQVALLAASPAFREQSGISSEKAAEYAAVVLDRINGVNGMDPKGHTWYMQTDKLDDLGKGEITEILWRGDRTIGKDSWDMGITQERNNFPPTLYGSGRINPSQNLVDAFPASNGYPITSPKANYDAKKPYSNRDPRLSAYIIYNESKYKNKTITTGSYAENDNKGANDGLNKLANSTRTGYYMKKLMREDCDPNSQTDLAQYHIPTRIRYTEIFLAYAEAANDAWGATGKGTHKYSAYEVIEALHKRAGITNNEYLESIKNDKAAFAKLIQNERRIELCFENKRFWDLRRWMLPLNEPVMGVNITKNADGTLNYAPIEVEKRVYDSSYMWYGPIPKGEVLKWSALVQNKGWQ